MKSIALPKAFLLTAIVGITALSLFGYTAFRKDANAIQAANLEDITWTSTQLELELGRFRETLTLFIVNDADTSTANVNNQFDILWSRIALSRQGSVGKRLAEYDKESMIIPRLFEHMKSVDRDVIGLRNGTISDARLLLDGFRPYSIEIRELTRTVTLAEEVRSAEIREELQSALGRTVLFGAVAIILTISALFYINRESLRYKILANNNKILADKASRASRAKSMFLTMMSHELRTPMNGVLGLLSLSKQGALQPSQKRLIDQAEQSGRLLVGLLADIFDLSVLQSGDVSLDRKPFEISQLSLAVKERFEPLARREGIVVSVDVDENCPGRILGDFRKMRQAFSHLAQYIVETAGARDIALNFSCEDNKLIVRLSFEYLSEGGEWTPDLILGQDTRGDEGFATDALGPAIARGYIEAMNGTILVDNPVGERIAVVTSIPIEEFGAKTMNVAVLSKSNAMAAICRAALKSDDIEFVQEGANVHIVLIESGHVTESAFIREAVETYPNALLVALGSPINREAFDFNIKLPLDFEKLREIVYSQIA